MNATPSSGAGPDILVQTQGVLRVVTLNRAAKANAMSAAMMRALTDALGGAPGDAHEAILLQSAAPRLFCAGADIAEFVAGPEALAAQEHALLGLIRQLARQPLPVIAIARGKASGAGAILLALADVVLAADDLEIACPEMRFGMFPIIVEAVLQSRLPPALATRLCLTAGSIPAAEAARLGVVTEVLPAADFEAGALARLPFYRERVAGLRIARTSRLRHLPPEALIAKVEAVAPLMAENFARPGVRERILDYLQGLRRRP